MLQKIREKSQGFLSWAIVIVIAIVFTAWGVNGFISFGGRGIVAAKVNGEAISWREVEDTYQRMLREYANQEDANLASLDTRQLKLDARQQLVRQTAVLLGAKKDGFYISDEQIIQFLRFGIPEFQENGRFSTEKFKAYLAQSGYSELMYQELVRNQLLFTQIRNGVMQSSFGLQPEIDLHVDLQYQKRDIGYTIIPIERFKAQTTVTEDEIKAFFEENKELYVAQEKVKLAYLEISLDDLMKKLTVEEESLQEFYQSRQAYYTSPELINARHILINAPKNSDEEKSGEARAKAEDILAQIKLGGDFAALAKQHSDDEDTAKKGGDLGWLGRGELPDALEAAVFELKEPKALAGVVQTPFGFHVVQLVERKEPVVEPFEDVRARVEKEYRQEQADRVFADKADELANMAFEFSDSLQPAAEALGLTIKTTQPFSKEGGTEELTSQPRIVDVAFSEEQLVEQHNSELIKINDQRYVVVRVAEHYPPYQQAFEEVRDEIEDFLITRAAREKASGLAAELQKALEQNSTPFKVTQKHQLSWKKREQVSRMDADLDPIIIREAFALPRPVDGAPHPVKSFALVNGDYVVVSLAKVHRGEMPEDMEMMKSIFEQQLSMKYGTLESNLYRDVLVDRAKVELKELP